MLTGPIDATQRLLERTGLTIDDIDTFEINEAFASVVLAWAKEVGADLERDQPQRRRHRPRPPARRHRRDPDDQGRCTSSSASGGRYGLVSMCCGGGLGTGTIIERL